MRLTHYQRQRHPRLPSSLQHHHFDLFSLSLSTIALVLLGGWTRPINATSAFNRTTLNGLLARRCKRLIRKQRLMSNFLSASDIFHLPPSSVLCHLHIKFAKLSLSNPPFINSSIHQMQIVFFVLCRPNHANGS